MPDILLGIIAGMLTALLMCMLIVRAGLPEIKPEEIYRLCLVHSIPLEQCKIPPRPYKRQP